MNPIISMQKVEYSVVCQNRDFIVNLVLNGCVKHSPLISRVYQKIEQVEEKTVFMRLFAEHVNSMIDQVYKKKGHFFLAEEASAKKIVAIYFGKPYGNFGLFPEGVTGVTNSTSCFSSITEDASILLEKIGYNQEPLFPPTPVYHQIAFAVDPAYSNRGIATSLSTFSTQLIRSLGYHAIVRESTGFVAPDEQLLQKQEQLYTVVSMTSRVARDIMIVFQLQVLSALEGDFIVNWFMQKTKVERVNLSFYMRLIQDMPLTVTHLDATAILHTIARLDQLKKQITHHITYSIIQRHIALFQTALASRYDENGTLLHIAASLGDYQAVRGLIEAGINPLLVEPKTHNTILHSAVIGENFECVAMIIHRYPQLVFLKNSQNLTPMQAAMSIPRTDLNHTRRLASIITIISETQLGVAKNRVN